MPLQLLGGRKRFNFIWIEIWEFSRALTILYLTPIFHSNLILNDVVNAKLLWKRIPDSTKQEAPELERLWRVGKHFWSSDYKAVFDELDKEEWSQLMQVCVCFTSLL